MTNAASSPELVPKINATGVDWAKMLPTKETVGFRFSEIRRERTGQHAFVAILVGNTVMAYDTFNIGRSEDRNKLVKSAFSLLGDLHKQAWPQDTIRHELDLCALKTPQLWEEERIKVISYLEEDRPSPLSFILKPYVLAGGGTILFAPPGAGKSYLLQAMSICIACGQKPTVNLWDVPAGFPVMYINLERSADSMHRREKALMTALGLNGESGVYYMHARGFGLKAIERRARKWLEQTGGGVMLDSVSRGQLGDLNENETGNNFVDLMNGLQARWWGAIAHTPRQTADHMYGSIHFDAGEDIGVKVSSQAKDNTLGIALEIVKANDIGKFPPQYLALQFSAPDAPLVGIKTATSGDYPELSAGKGMSRQQTVIAFVLKAGRATATQTANATGLPRPDISTMLLHSGEFQMVEKVGKDVFYGVIDWKHP